MCLNIWVFVRTVVTVTHPFSKPNAALHGGVSVKDESFWASASKSLNRDGQSGKCFSDCLRTLTCRTRMSHTLVAGLQLTQNCGPCRSHVGPVGLPNSPWSMAGGINWKPGQADLELLTLCKPSWPRKLGSLRLEHRQWFDECSWCRTTSRHIRD